MFEYYINPIMFRIGSFGVSYYAIVYLIGFLASLYLLVGATKRNEIDLNKRQVYDLMVYLIAGIIIGARVFHIVFWDLEYFSSHLVEMISIWNGGLSFHGGFVGGLLGLLWFSRKNKVSLGKITDILVLPAVFFLALGRIANFINQEIVGTMTGASWCVKFYWDDGCRHPVQLYASFGRFALFGLLLWIKKSLKHFKSGLLSWIFVFLIGAGRYFTDFFREGIVYNGLLTGQWLSLIMVAVSGVVLWKKYRSDLKKVKNIVL
jgi:phosphatidylglycerol---prolipoprotein diacylglyceryl transferase